MGETENRVSIKERRKKAQSGSALAVINENKSMLILFGVIVAALAVILISILALKISAVAVCLVVVIEAALAVCLHDVPIWLHGLAVIAQIVVGILIQAVVFVALGAAIYIVGILALRFLKD